MPGRHTLLRLAGELTKLARPRHQVLVEVVASRAGVGEGNRDGVDYAVDRLADLPLHVRVPVDVLAVGLAAAGPDRAIDILERGSLPLVDMYPKLVRSLVLFATYDPRPKGRAA